jgi:hypothetical protein
MTEPTMPTTREIEVNKDNAGQRWRLRPERSKATGRVQR